MKIQLSFSLIKYSNAACRTSSHCTPLHSGKGILHSPLADENAGFVNFPWSKVQHCRIVWRINALPILFFLMFMGAKATEVGRFFNALFLRFKMSLLVFLPPASVSTIWLSVSFVLHLALAFARAFPRALPLRRGT